MRGEVAGWGEEGGGEGGREDEVGQAWGHAGVGWGGWGDDGSGIHRTAGSAERTSPAGGSAAGRRNGSVARAPAKFCREGTPSPR